MACNLTTESFNGKTAGDAFLDDEWKCRACKLHAGFHPSPGFNLLQCLHIHIMNIFLSAAYVLSRSYNLFW